MRCDGTARLLFWCVRDLHAGPHGLLAEFPPSVSFSLILSLLIRFVFVVVIFVRCTDFSLFSIGECPYPFSGASYSYRPLFDLYINLCWFPSWALGQVKYHTNTNENAPFSFFGQQVFDLFFHGALTLAPDCVYWWERKTQTKRQEKKNKKTFHSVPCALVII